MALRLTFTKNCGKRIYWFWQERSPTPFLEGPMGLIIEGRNGLGVPPGSSQGSQMPLRVPGTHHTL